MGISLLRETPPSDTTPPKSAPGFGIGRGQGDPTVVGFAIGQGRANFTGCGILQGSPLHSTIGSSYLVDKGDRGYEDSNAFHYPHVKLLDIYWTIQTLPSFAKYPDGFMEVQLLTQGKISEPLAFIIPDKEEESVLEGIQKGDIVSSGAVHSSTSIIAQPMNKGLQEDYGHGRERGWGIGAKQESVFDGHKEDFFFDQPGLGDNGGDHGFS